MTNEPTIFIIFGATGDLVSKKIIPSLYHLFSKNHLPKQFAIIGVSSDKKSNEEFQNMVYEDLMKHQGIHINTCGEFCQIFEYHEGDFGKEKTYINLGKKIEQIESSWGVCSNKLFCLAVPPLTYTNILEQLNASGLTKPCGGIDGWSRVLIEKPFGNDLKSARLLCKATRKLLKEEQVYHIDHYLGKEMMRNVLAFRFANDLFAGGWNNEHIAEINIRLHEMEGVEMRGRFYDSVGALRDVGQNHLLEMLALICMQNPRRLNAKSVREARLLAIQGLSIPTKAEVEKNTYRAQYEGYKKITGVNSKSTKETFFSLSTTLTTPEWRGVKVTLEAGKKLLDRKKEIEIVFHHPSDCLCTTTKESPKPSRIVFSIEPEEDIGIYFLAKEPGLMDMVEPQEMHFNMRDVRLSEKYVEEYEKLILDAIAGDQTLFVSADEIEASWKFIDAIESAWASGSAPLKTYTEFTDEPIKAALAKFTPLPLKALELKKEIQIIGLGKMGGNIAKQLAIKGWKVSGYDAFIKDTSNLIESGIIVKNNLEDLLPKGSERKIVWLMIPAGDALDKIIFNKGGLTNFLKKGDVIVDGGNSYYKDSIFRAKKLKKFGIHYIDAGVSGGPKGALLGATVMVGGEKKIVAKIENLFVDLACQNGYSYLGGSGAGHFAKMVHNGIEYGMMQSLAEGFEILKKSDYKYDLSSLAELYNNGSVISGRLNGWLADAFRLDSNTLKDISGSVSLTGEAEWTSKTAKRMGIKTPVINASIAVRKGTAKEPSYQGKILSAMREQFGGHKVRTNKNKAA